MGKIILGVSKGNKEPTAIWAVGVSDSRVPVCQSSRLPREAFLGWAGTYFKESQKCFLLYYGPSI